MPYVTLVLVPAGEDLYPVDGALVEPPEFSEVCLRNISLLDDGTAITLYQEAGDPDRVEARLDGADVLAYDVSQADGYVNAYIHFVPNDALAGVLELLQRHELILVSPVEYAGCGGLRITLVGEAETFRKVRSAMPDDVRLRVEDMGTYTPEAHRLFSQLTSRQQETLEAAIAAGYYEVPRQATHDDVAERLDRTQATVGEHLRKVEARVLSQIVP